MKLKLIVSLTILMTIFSQFALAEKIKIQQVQYIQQQNIIKVKGKIDENSSPSDKTLNKVKIFDAANTSVVFSELMVKKAFKSQFNTSELASLPCKIGVVVNDDFENISYADLKPSPDNCGAFATTITGKITDEPIPYAHVSVTLNGKTFTTIADAFGQYSLDILTTNIEQLVVIESTAQSDEIGGEINFVNMVGSFSKVLSNNEPINVTNVSTASYLLIVEANGGTPPTNAQELALAETSVDVTRLFTLAAIIKLIVDDPEYRLPDGFTRLIDFVSNTAAVDAYIAATPTDAINSVLAQILADSDLVAGFSIDDVPAYYYAVATTNPGYIARSASALEFDLVNKTGTTLGIVNGQSINEAFNWQIVDGRIEVNYLAPQAIEQLVADIETVTDDPDIINQFHAAGGVNDLFVTQQRVTQRAYTRVVDGNLVDVIAVTTKIEYTTPDITLADGSTLTISQPKFVIDNSSETFRSSLDINPIPFEMACSNSPTCVQGSWGGVYHYSPGKRVYDDSNFPETAYADMITFASDMSAYGQISNVNAMWALDNAGQLVITYANGMVQTSQIIDKNGLEYGVFSQFNDGENRYVSYDIWVKANPLFILDAAYLQPSLAGDFWTGEVNSWLPGSYDDNGLLIPERLWGWEFSGKQVSNIAATQWSEPDVNGFSSVEFNIRPPVSYEINTDIIEIERFYFAKRYWYPLAETIIDGERVFYVIEREDRDAEKWFGGLPGFFSFIPARMNIEREKSRSDYTNVAR